VTYQRFEDLPVWQASMGLLEKVYEFTDAAETQMRRRASLRTQLERATLSISNNIAEGFERGTTNELLGFLYIAKGSAGEVRSMLSVRHCSEISNLKS
jgi:four helix bundle protein